MDTSTLNKDFMQEVARYNDGNGCTRQELVDRLIAAILPRSVREMELYSRIKKLEAANTRDPKAIALKVIQFLDAEVSDTEMETLVGIIADTDEPRDSPHRMFSGGRHAGRSVEFCFNCGRMPCVGLSSCGLSQRGDECGFCSQGLHDQCLYPKTCACSLRWATSITHHARESR